MILTIRKLIRQLIHKQENDLKTQTDKIHIGEIHIGEVVYTKSNVCVLDIGLVERLSHFRVYARYSKYHNNGKLYYGNPRIDRWHGTGIYKTYDEWKYLTMGKGTNEICNILGIPYWMKGAYEE